MLGAVLRWLHFFMGTGRRELNGHGVFLSGAPGRGTEVMQICHRAMRDRVLLLSRRWENSPA